MDNKNLNGSILQTRQHFEILDGLRGIAALAIVIFHFMEWIYPDYSKNFIGHGFLAVDFFFCLSGFVIGYAYDNRIKEIGVIEFFKSRFIRLHPLVISGAVLGIVGLLFDPFSSQSAPYSTGKLILLFMCTIFLIPFPVMQDRAFNLFGLNAPTWSLFWEYVANIVYAFILCKIKRRLLIVLTLAGAAALCFVGYRTGNLLGGWSKDNFWDGGARISYSFLAGLLIYRSGWILKNRLGFIPLTVLLSLAFLMPSFKWNWLSELLVVLFYFPLMVSLGAGSKLSSGVRNICVFSGKMSYPLYMTHYAGIWIFGNYITNNKLGPGTLTLIVIAGTIALTAFSYVVMVVYDIPVRRYLSNKRKQSTYKKR
jgi:peptidoglycan/LPS O-acetylase OafA/YrhL